MKTLWGGQYILFPRICSVQFGQGFDKVLQCKHELVSMMSSMILSTQNQHVNVEQVTLV